MNKTEERLFEVNHFYEKLLNLRRTDPKAFGEMSPASKLSLYAYEAAKRARKTSGAPQRHAA